MSLTEPAPSKLCRTCLCSLSESYWLLDIDIISIIKECASVQLNVLDESPIICDRCRNCIMDFHKFKLKLLEVEEFYANTLTSGNVKPVELTDFESNGFTEDFFQDVTVKKENGFEETSSVFDSSEMFTYNVTEDCSPTVSELSNHSEADSLDVDNSKITGGNKVDADKEMPIKCSVCVHCTQVFTNRGDLHDHKKTKHVDYNYSVRVRACKYCRKKYRGLNNLLRHFTTRHKNKNPKLTCNECSEKFHIRDQLRYHKLQFHKPQKCQVCSKMVNGRDKMQCHLKRHAEKYLHDNNLLAHRLTYTNNVVGDLLEKDHPKEIENNTDSFRCKECLRLFTTRRQLHRHSFKHVKVKPFKCKECDKSFCQLNLLSTHVKEKHQAKEVHKCEKCPKRFVLSESLNKHVENHHFSQPCPHCGKLENTKEGLRRHIAVVHPSSGPFTCQECGGQFKLEKTYQRHMMRHKGVDFRKMCTHCGLKVYDLNLHLFQKHQIGNRTFKCRRCNEIFTDQKAWKKHSETMHRKQHNPEEYKFPCHLCQRRFLHAQFLDRHLKLSHVAPRMFPCNVCGREFKLKRVYEDHLRIHTGERPYQCEFCDMKFTIRKTLTVHRRIHTGEKPYKCDICGKRFSHNSSHTAHMKTHTKFFPERLNLSTIS